MNEVVIITGPSGVGKDTLVTNLLQTKDDYIPAAYNTSRTPRVFIDYNHLKQQLTYLANMPQDEELILSCKHGTNPCFNSFYFSDLQYLTSFLKAQTLVKELLNKLTDKNNEIIAYQCANNDILRALIHLNDENQYINWIGPNDEQRIKKDHDALCETTINGFYYAQTISDILMKLKTKNVIVNATPDTWAEIKTKLDELDIPTRFIWIDASANVRKDRMLKRGDSLEKVENRLKFDETIWNTARLDEVKTKFYTKVINGEQNKTQVMQDFSAALKKSSLKM